MFSLEPSKLKGESPNVGNEMFQFMCELFPICRSITGDGVRQTHRLINQHIPIVTKEVPTGTRAFDWTVPKEWNIKDAYIIGPDGTKIVDFKISNLHVLNYSVPIRKTMSLSELRPHLFSLPTQPNVVPYLTSYYKDNWGFCLTHNQLMGLSEGQYQVVIDSTLEDGAMTTSEIFLPGKTKDEILITCYTCHPSLCNDNLSGTVLATFLAKYLQNCSLRYSYRFLFIPETIGAIAWLSMNEPNVARIKHGLVAVCVGDSGNSTYKRSRRGNAEIDRAVVNALKHSGSEFSVVDFFPWGSDERQFSSPGFNLPVGSLMRTPYGKYPEYHTSADNLDLVQAPFLEDSFFKYLSALYILENNETYLNLNPKCEPLLGKRGLYALIGAQKDGGIDHLAMFWVLNLSDGCNSLLDISDRSGMAFELIKKAADALLQHNLLAPVAKAHSLREELRTSEALVS